MSIQEPAPHIVLASASASRAALLRNAGIVFEAFPASIDEAEIKRSAQSDGTSADETATLLAELKAQRVARRQPDALVIGADQLLVCDGRWFDKPESLAEARDHLMALRGKTHRLVTAVVCQREDRRIWHHVATPKMTMRPLSDAFIDDYLGREGSAVTTTVGAYRLEGLGVHLFDAIEGSLDTIMGLPLLPLFGFLRQHGVLHT